MDNTAGSNSDNVFASLHTVLSLWWNGNQLQSFRDIWWWIFLWALFSSIFVHGLAFLISICTLHKHKQGRWYCLSFIVMGLFTPLIEGVITSALISGVFVSIGWSIGPKYALICGAGQTAVVVLVSWTRLLPTL